MPDDKPIDPTIKDLWVNSGFTKMGSPIQNNPFLQAYSRYIGAMNEAGQPVLSPEAIRARIEQHTGNLMEAWDADVEKRLMELYKMGPGYNPPTPQKAKTPTPTPTMPPKKSKNEQTSQDNQFTRRELQELELRPKK